MLLLCALMAGSGSAWADEGDELAICQGTGSGYGVRRTLTDSHSVDWVLASGQSGYLGANSTANHGNVKPTAADLPVVKAVKSDATTTTTGYYFYYTTTPVANVGSLVFSYTGNSGNQNATAYVVVGDAVSAANGNDYEIISLASTSTTAQDASLGTSGTFTYTFSQTQTSARYYGFIIVTSSYKRLTTGTIKLLEGVTEDENQVKKPSITIPAGVFVSSKTVTIETETDGATIYYTTDGTEPTISSTEYTGTFKISATTTIKAIAVKTGMTASRVAEATFTKATVLTGISGLAGATTTGTETTNYVNLTNAQVTYASNTTGYIEDATNGFYINGIEVTKNNVYNGIFEIKSKLYYSNPQITAITAVEGTITNASSDKAPTEITTSALEDEFNANLGRQMKLSGVLITSGPKVGSMNINDLGNNTITVGKGYDLVGYPSVYNSGKRFNVVTATQAPINPTIVVEDQSVAYGGTFTVDESKISGGDITVTSSNPAVATVSGLVITATAVGTTTITVSTAASEDYKAGSATFTLTVTAPEGSSSKPNAYDIVELDFTNNSWSFPEGSSNKIAEENSYTSGNYTITLIGSTNNGYYYNTTDNYLLLGQSGATLTLPAFQRDVTKIIISGRTNASLKVEQNIYVGETAVSTSTTGATGDNTYEIASGYQTAGTIYTIKVTSAHNTQFTKIKVYLKKEINAPSVTLNGSGYASYCSEYPLDFTNASGYKAYVVSAVDGANVTFTQVEGKIKGGQGIILYGAPNGICQLEYADSENVPTANKLIGTLVPTYFIDNDDDNHYFGLNGDTFMEINAGTIPANKAYLKISNAEYNAIPATAARLNIVFEDVQGIETVNSETINNNRYYDLQGRSVAQPVKGLYIMNGKKVMMK